MVRFATIIVLAGAAIGMQISTQTAKKGVNNAKTAYDNITINERCALTHPKVFCDVLGLEVHERDVAVCLTYTFFLITVKILIYTYGKF